MTRKKWTTPEQEDWLKAHCKGFAEAEETNATRTFYQTIVSSWLEKWPNPAPTETEIQEAGELQQATKDIFDCQEKVRLPALIYVIKTSPHFLIY